MRFQILLSCTIVLLSCCFVGCNTPMRCGYAAPRPARINHLAFFKLKNPADADELIADCDRMLATIPGVVSYYAGKHIDTGRTNIDANYDVGFFVGFTTEAAYARYVEHPNHIAAVNKWKPRWEWIRIHDVLDETP